MSELTKVEEQIMKIIWEMRGGFVKEFIEKLPEPKPPYNTISSVVRILEKKGFVNHKAYGRTHQYFPIITENEYRKFITTSLLRKYFSGSPKQLVSFFAKEEKIDANELSEIIAEIEKLKNE